MNILGPCVNPAEPPVQLLGVAEPNAARAGRATLAALGVERALVVHGSGLDEVALHGETKAVRSTDGALERLTITPEHAGLARAPLADAQGRRSRGECRAAEGAAAWAMAPAPRREAVALNAGALLMTAGMAADLREGAALALRRSWRRATPYRRARRRSSRRPWLNRLACSARSSRASESTSRRGCAGVSLDDLRAQAAPTARSLARRARPARRALHHGGEAGLAVAGRASAGADPAAIARAYRGAADAISVLTDTPYFGGSLDDLRAVRAAYSTGRSSPRISSIDPRQVAEARIAGADAVLAMLSVLDDEEARGDDRRGASGSAWTCWSRRMTRPRCAARSRSARRMIGINNRDLKTLEVDLAVTERLAPPGARRTG